MSVALALAGAVIFGTGDFFGGLASRRIALLSVLLVSQSTGLAGMLLASLAVRGDPSGVDLLLGAAAGLAGGAGVTMLYRGLATGSMSLVAPVTGVVASVVPVIAGVAFGERPAALQLAGIVIAVGSVALLGGGPSTAPSAPRRWSPLLLAVGAGAGFGLFFIALSRTASAAGLWPIAAARGATVSAFVLAALATRSLRKPLAGNLPILIATGVLDVAANVLYLVAVHAGLLSIVAVLISLYPAATVVCSMVVLGERLRRMQVTGVIAALIAVVLIAAG
ncbi:MAG: DMT family transporter [Chloroflexi bacterium]|nr:MAG: DMT family transporter [Chloroflexota bacterium]